MKVKVIKTKTDYETATARIDELMEAFELSADDADELEVLAVLVDQYEEEKTPIDYPSPIDAIRFRMDQQGLRQVDLVEYFGSKSKVSEVLSGKRPLSLKMVRKINAELNIPAEVLLQEPNATIPEDSIIDWTRFPIAEMRKRHWFEGFEGSLSEAKQRAEYLIRSFAKHVGPELLNPIYCRTSRTDGKKMNGYALAAWRIRVFNHALKNSIPTYKPGTVTKKFARALVGLSFFEDGPTLAKEYLNKHGIHLVTERHLTKTYLDGASMITEQGHPIVALTLRYDRLDNFWFTLCHELAHISLHLEERSIENEFFFDDLEQPSNELNETQANEWASTVMIDQTRWSRAGLGTNSTDADIVEWANKEKIGPSIPSGRIRKESGNWKLFSRLVGSKKVRVHFLRSGW